MKNILGITIANAVVFYLAAMMFGAYVTFGNATTNYYSAIVLNAFIVTLAVSTVEPIMRRFKISFSPTQLMLLYFAVNSSAIYIIARTAISTITGIGISAFWVALVLGFVVNFIQYGVWKLLTKKK